MTIVALYARVSSDKQAKADTISSQIAAIENRIRADGYSLLNEFKFVDNGYSGSYLVRPGLEKLRDKVSAGEIDKIYIHSPDRLSRKYAYQMILIEEFKKSNTDVIFLNCEINNSPESHLLLQVQGMIAEYERTKIMERNRRGKIYSAKRGSVSALSNAPYGYIYIDKHKGGGQAFYEINEKESEVVRNIFYWTAHDRLSMGTIRRKLENMNIPSATGKSHWSRAAIAGIIRNPAYTGKAAFGKTKTGSLRPVIRPSKHSSEQPRKNTSVYRVDKENWISISVPAIIDEDIFILAQEQLEENKKLNRTRQTGEIHLLQGMVVCQRCHYGYYWKCARNKKKKKIDRYGYYRCTGSDAYRFGGSRICDNKYIRSDALETAVWEEIKFLLKEPKRIAEEHRRRMLELDKSSLDHTRESLEQEEKKLKRGISRLIDSYSQEYITRQEFEPRIKAMKHHLKRVEENKLTILKQKDLRNELKLIITNLEHFTNLIKSNLENVDLLTKRAIIRALVKRIEITIGHSS